MEDFDVLVRPKQAPAAIRVLREAGWRPQYSAPERYIPVVHAMAFKNVADHECDLHFHVLPESCQPEGDDDFWDAALSAKIGGVSTRVLNPTNQLFHVCMHGARSAGTTSMRWVCDAITIVTSATASGDSIDWPRLATQARKLRLTLLLQDTIRYLRDGWDVAVPPAVLHSLQETPVSRVERLEYAVWTHPQTSTPLDVALLHWAQNARLVGDSKIIYQLARLPTYLRRYWGLDHYHQLPLRAAYGLASRVVALASGKPPPAPRRGSSYERGFEEG
jgi:hypothetical protein